MGMSSTTFVPLPAPIIRPASASASANATQFLNHRFWTQPRVPAIPEHATARTSYRVVSPSPTPTIITSTTTPTSSTSSSNATTTPTATPDSTYDYVIVGGGAAGCVLANRLSADTNSTVLLLETGPSSSSFFQNMPLGFPSLIGSPLDSGFITEPEPYLNDRRLYFPRGRLLGGSHAISVMLYHRGHPYDYDQWEQAAGSQWSAESVAPYFKQSQTQTSLKKRGTANHGSQGPLPVSDLQTVNPMSSAFIDAAVASGHKVNEDFNDWSHDQSGFGEFQVTQRDGNRATPATSYLDSIRGRRNLTVRPDATAERILFEQGESQPPVAVGVSIIDPKGHRRIIRAENEVILSAGVYASPQLLMLSGIGPGEHLASFGIPVVADSPKVGQNLQDHAAAMLTYHSQNPFVDKSKSSLFYTEQTGKSIPVLLNYLLRGKGPLTSPMCETGGFVRTDSESEACDLQIRFIPFFSEPDPYGSLEEFSKAGTYLRNEANRPAGFTLQSVTARPKSRGNVELRSSDVRDSLRINANWMSNDADMRTLVEGIKICRGIAGADALAAYRGEEKYPGGSRVSDSDLEAYVRDTCHTANAMVGTCSMGSGEDAVVDADLRVRGVQRLRVIDSSVMPTLPGGQSGAPTMMVAEKGADLVLKTAASRRDTS